MSFWLTLADASPSRAIGNSCSTISCVAPTVSPSSQTKAALRPCLAAARKFPLTSSNSMSSVMSLCCFANPSTDPIQKATLAVSSAIVGPDGMNRHSIRR